MSKPTPKKYDLVTEKRMVELMAQWAHAADASFSAKLAVLKEELRAEFTVVVPPCEYGPAMTGVHGHLPPGEEPSV